MTAPRVVTTYEPPETSRLFIALLNPAYPPELLQARRAEFVKQIADHNTRAMLEAELDAVARALPTADNRDELIAYAAELLTGLDGE